MSDFRAIEDLIRRGRRFLLTSHVNPDGDALGSMLGLGLSLESIGKEVLFYNADGVPPHLDFLPHGGRVSASLEDMEGTFDASLILDCTDVGRVGEAFQRELGSGRFGKTVIIDHHHTKRRSADLHVLFPKAGATGEIIYSLLKHLGVNPSPDAATCLYTAILSDTGSFHYSNTSSRVMRAAADLVDLGAVPWKVSEAIYESEPLRKLRLLALALPTLEVSDGGRVASVVVDDAMLRKACCGKADTEGFVNFPRSIKGVYVAVLFRQEEDSKWKISLRSKGGVNVAEIAEGFGGGGHERAAGCSIDGSLAKVKEAVLSSISEALKWGE